MDVKLLVVQGKARGQHLLFPDGEYVFGRGPECHVRPDSEWVSRQHCLLRINGNAVSLRDLGSTNGTLVNGVRVVGDRILQIGDQVQIGPLVFQVVVEENSSFHPQRSHVRRDTKVNTSRDTAEEERFTP
ncbi:MAG: FHA domain-containing protein [Planctomycetes bacterium]|nr:FHA domain-containing protein [Planctomycetota bacterium]